MTIAIDHPKAPLVLLRQEYLEATGWDFCGAKILAVLENWHNWKQSRGLKQWIRLSLSEIHQHLFGEHSIGVIRRSLDWICDRLGLVERRHNPKVPYDRTYQYRFDLDLIQKRIDEIRSGGHLSHLANGNVESETIHLSHLADQNIEDKIEKLIDIQQAVVESDLERKQVSIQQVEQLVPPGHSEQLRNPLVNNESPSDDDLYSAVGTEALKKVEAMGVALNPALRALVLSSTLDTVQDALAALQERLERGLVRNASGFLRRAIEGNWKPSSVDDKHQPQTAPVGFREWFDQAKTEGLVRGSMLVEGVLKVMMADGKWLDWQVARHFLEPL